ncbi:hypothetical protein IV102_05920 [bacterium]|nr:hypothetical protein [bacterium]
MNSLTYFQGAKCTVRAFPPGTHTLKLDPGQQCFFLSGRAEVVGTEQFVGFQVGPIVAGDVGLSLQLRVLDKLYCQLGYACAELAREFEAKIQGLQRQFNGFRGGWRSVDGTLPGSTPVLVVCAAPGPLSRQLVHWGIPFGVIDLSYLCDQKVGSPQCELRRWKEALLQLPLRFRETLLMRREDTAWLWAPGGQSLEQALVDLPRIQHPHTPREESWLGQVVDHWRTLGYSRELDCDLAVFAKCQVSSDFAEHYGLSVVARVNPGCFGPRLEVRWSQHWLFYRFVCRDVWECWRVPLLGGGKLDFGNKELVGSQHCSLTHQEMVKWCRR